MHNLDPFSVIAILVVLVIVDVIRNVIIDARRDKKMPKPLIVVRVPCLDPISEEDGMNPTMVEQIEKCLGSKQYNDYRFIVIESNYDAEEITFEVLPINQEPLQISGISEVELKEQLTMDSKMHFPKL